MAGGVPSRFQYPLSKKMQVHESIGCVADAGRCTDNSSSAGRSRRKKETPDLAMLLNNDEVAREAITK